MENSSHKIKFGITKVLLDLKNIIQDTFLDLTPEVTKQEMFL